MQRQKYLEIKKKLLIMIMINIATSEFNDLIAKGFVARLAQVKLVIQQTDFDTKLTSLNQRIIVTKQSMYLLETNQNN